MSAVTVARVVDTADLRRSLDRLHIRIQVTIGAQPAPGEQRYRFHRLVTACDQCGDATCPPVVSIEWPRPGDELDVEAVVGAECAWRYLAAEVLPYVSTESRPVQVEIERWA